MSEETDSEVGRFVLPFSDLSEKKRKPFNPDMEYAAVFAIAELNRGRGGRIILRHAKEKTIFIAKIGYPVWLYPISNNVLLFDGLNLIDYSMPYTQISDVNVFTDSLKTGFKTRVSYLTFLADYTDYFAKSGKEKTLPLRGLIIDSGFIEEFDSYRQEAMKMEKALTNLGLLSSSIDESNLISITHEMASLRSSFEKEVKALEISMRMLGKTSQTFLKEFRDEEKVVKEEFAVKIKKEEAIVSIAVNDLREQYDKKIIELDRNFQRHQLPLHKEKLKLEKAQEEIEKEIEQKKLDAKAIAESDDPILRQRWKQEIKDSKQGLSEVEVKLKVKEKALEDLEKKRTAESLTLKSQLETEVKDARKNLVELEATRDAKILVIKQEMEKLENQTKLITNQIGATVKLKETNIAQFKKFYMRPYSDEMDKALFYVPFYVICYEAKADKRYLVLPPSSVGAMGISTKLRGALGRSRIKSFLVSRFKEISSLSATIREQSQKNSMFETELKKLGAKNNVLAMSSTRDEIEKGLLRLKEQGWLSDKDYGAIMANAKSDLKMND